MAAVFDQYAVVLMPVSAELPFPDDLDQQGAAGFDRVWEAQLTMRAAACDGFAGSCRHDATR